MLAMDGGRWPLGDTADTGLRLVTQEAAKLFCCPMRNIFSDQVATCGGNICVSFRKDASGKASMNLGVWTATEPT